MATGGQEQQQRQQEDDAPHHHACGRVWLCGLWECEWEWTAKLRLADDGEALLALLSSRLWSAEFTTTHLHSRPSAQARLGSCRREHPEPGAGTAKGLGHTKTTPTNLKTSPPLQSFFVDGPDPTVAPPPVSPTCAEKDIRASSPSLTAMSADAEHPSPAPLPSCAFVTLITTDSFGPGARVLLHSLQSTMTTATSKPATILLVTPQVTEGIRKGLRGLCDDIIEVQPIPNPYAAETHVGGWVDSGFTKLRIWELIKFERVVYLDADCLVLEDLQELFALDVDFAAAPDVFPPDRFNAGVLLVRPNLVLFNGLVQQASTRALPSYDGGDTGFLNAYFHDWSSGPLLPTTTNSSSYVSSRDISLARLPFAWNAQRTMHWMTHAKAPGYWESVAPFIKVLHFSSSPKPWEAEGAKKKGELEMKWWAAFVQAQMAGMMVG